MKKYSFLLAMLIPLSLWGQNDTTIWYSKVQKTLGSEVNATYYESITKKPKNRFVLSTNELKDNKWTRIDENRMERFSDSSLLITSFKNPEDRTYRFFQKTDSGYHIRDLKKGMLLQEGMSKLIFPLIKTGHWHQFNAVTGKLYIEALYGDNQMISNKYWISDNEFINNVFYIVDKNPDYEGGEPLILKYISDNAIYPEDARLKGIEGKVFVSFILMSDGTMRGIHLLNKNNPALEYEAIRVVKSVPLKFIPAEIGGKKVNVPYMIPVTFQLIPITRGN